MCAERDKSQGIGFVYEFPKKVRPPEESTTIQKIRENLDRLQKLHRRLHEVLEELESAQEKKRR